MESVIKCPVCRVGEIRFDYNLFLTGASFSCSDIFCDASIKLPVDSQAPVKAAFEKIKAIKKQNKI